jgi:hypothetical protein
MYHPWRPSAPCKHQQGRSGAPVQHCHLLQLLNRPQTAALQEACCLQGPQPSPSALSPCSRQQSSLLQSPHRRTCSVMCMTVPSTHHLPARVQAPGLGAPDTQAQPHSSKPGPLWCTCSCITQSIWPGAVSPSGVQYQRKQQQCSDSCRRQLLALCHPTWRVCAALQQQLQQDWHQQPQPAWSQRQQRP